MINSVNVEKNIKESYNKCMISYMISKEDIQYV